MNYAGHNESFAATVFFTGQPVMRVCSLTQHVHGDEAGTGGGVKSGTHGGICEPIEHAAQFRVEGSPVIRHLDRCYSFNSSSTKKGTHEAMLRSLARTLLAFGAHAGCVRGHPVS